MINVMNWIASLNDEVPAPLSGTRPCRGSQARTRGPHGVGAGRKNRAPQAHGAARRPHNAVLEPLLTDQWFVDIKPLAAPAKRPSRTAPSGSFPTTGRGVLRVDATHQGLVHQPPALVGPSHPAWYDRDGRWYVARSESEVRPSTALDRRWRYGRTRTCSIRGSLRTLAIPTQGWPLKTRALETYYPTSVLVTGFDIIFFSGSRA